MGFGKGRREKSGEEEGRLYRPDGSCIHVSQKRKRRGTVEISFIKITFLFQYSFLLLVKEDFKNPHTSTNAIPFGDDFAADL